MCCVCCSNECAVCSLAKNGRIKAKAKIVENNNDPKSEDQIAYLWALSRLTVPMKSLKCISIVSLLISFGEKKRKKTPDEHTFLYFFFISHVYSLFQLPVYVFFIKIQIQLSNSLELLSDIKRYHYYDLSFKILHSGFILSTLSTKQFLTKSLQWTFQPKTKHIIECNNNFREINAVRWLDSDSTNDRSDHRHFCRLICNFFLMKIDQFLLIQFESRRKSMSHNWTRCIEGPYTLHMKQNPRKMHIHLKEIFSHLRCVHFL